MQEIIRLTKDLIRFKSIQANPEEINHCFDFIENFLKNNHIGYRRLDHRQTPSILVAPQDKTVPVLLMSHIDVVEGPDALFEPYEKDGMLHGRGSIDDKYAAAMSLVLLKESVKRLKGRGSADDLPFGILITGDEEVGGKDGAAHALSQVRTDFCIALDGGGVDKIVVKEKGIVHLKLMSRGKSAHSARPWLGENAIENLIDDYHVIKTFFEQSTPDHWHRTLNFSRIQAGKSINQVPDTAEAVFDVRYTEHDDMAEVVRSIRGQIKGELVVEKTEPLFLGGDSPYLELLLGIAQGTRTDFEHGASDARHLSQYGMQGIVWGADGEMSQHTSQEHLVVASVYKLYEILDKFMQNVATGGV
jgi:succinyl-diaminopimelate desuccinylase